LNLYKVNLIKYLLELNKINLIISMGVLNRESVIKKNFFLNIQKRNFGVKFE